MDITEARTLIEKYRTEMAKKIVGQKQLIDGILMGIIAGGHVLLEGVPGLAKTLAIKTCAEIAGLEFKRIQFTPDLLPADLIGTLFYEQSKGQFSVRKGPVFTNLILADEINRSPAKVQSALLEAMAEKQVTIGDTTYSLPEPFFVLATQNPIEQEGTYNLPEAELDRFLLKLQVPYPSLQDEFVIVKNHTIESQNSAPLQKVLTISAIHMLRRFTNDIIIDDKIIEYIVSLTAATRLAQNQSNTLRGKDDMSKYILFGSSPRGSIAIRQCAKIAALFEGRAYVLPEDVKLVAPHVLRHRLVLSYEASADGLTADTVITKLLSIVPVP